MVRKYCQKPRLELLESRLTPAGSNHLISAADPSLPSDTAGGTITLANGAANLPSMSQDARFTVFTSSAANIIPGQIDDNQSSDIFVFDQLTNTTELISRAAGSALKTGNGSSVDPSISADGRYIAFSSSSRDLLNGTILPEPPYEYGTNKRNVYLFDRQTGQTKLVSHRFSGDNDVPSYESEVAMVSANGECVAFGSYAVDLIAGFSNPGGTNVAANRHLYSYNVATGGLTLVDHQFGSTTIPGNKNSGGSFLISDDARYIVFGTSAGNLLETNWTSKHDTYRHDRLTGINHLISRTSMTAPYGGNGITTPNDMSPDGRWITLFSQATNLIPGISNGASGQVVLYDVETSAFHLVSHVPGNLLGGGNGQSVQGEVSDDGRYVAYVSTANDLVSGFVDGNGSNNNDVYLFDRVTNQTQLVSYQAGSPTTGSNGAVNFPFISVNGDFVVYASQATNLVEGFIDGNIAINEDLYSFARSSGVNSLISGSNGSKAKGGNGRTRDIWMSPDGKYVAAVTEASDLMSGVFDANDSDDVILVDTSTHQMTLVTARHGGASSSAGSESMPSGLSADGRFMVFTSTARNLVPGQIDPTESQDIFLKDRLTGTITLVSRKHGTVATAATNSEVFLGSAIPVISADGRYVAYGSYSLDLVEGFVDSNGGPPVGTGLYLGTDIFLFDRVTGVTELVSRKTGTTNVGGNLTSGTYYGSKYGLISISDDGQYVAYMSQATDLVDGLIDNNGSYPTSTVGKGGDVYVYDRVNKTNSLISHLPGHPLATGDQFSGNPILSGDGQIVTYWGGSNNLVTGMTGGGRAVFLYDRSSKSTALVSHVFGSSTQAGNGGSDQPFLSRDGKFVVFQSAANNLVNGQIDTNDSNDVFLYEVATGEIELVSHTHSSPSSAGDLFSQLGYIAGTRLISEDGRFVTYQSGASNLVAGFIDGNGQDAKTATNMDIFLYDRLSGTSVVVSHAYFSPTAGGTNLHGSNLQSISGNGRFVTFWSNGVDHVEGLNGPNGPHVKAMYVFDRLTGTIRVLSHALNNVNVTGNDGSSTAILNYDGSVIFYSTEASDLVVNDFNVRRDAIAYVTPPPRVTSVQINDGSPQRSVIRSMTITLDDYVFVDSGPLSVSSSQGQAVGSVQWAAEYKNNTTILTVTFGGAGTEFGSLADGKYTLTVIGNRVSGIGFLDGNGDGLGGDDYTFQFHRLFGDGNGDGIVNAVDFNAFRLAYSGSGMAFDFNNDGVVSAVDFMQFRLRYGVTI